jgi:hypothetical protein
MSKNLNESVLCRSLLSELYLLWMSLEAVKDKLFLVANVFGHVLLMTSHLFHMGKSTHWIYIIIVPTLM